MSEATLTSVTGSGAQEAVQRLNRRFFLDFPAEAASRIETADAEDVLPALVLQPATVLLPVWRRLNSTAGTALLSGLPRDTAVELLASLMPSESLRLLMRMEEASRESYLDALDPSIAGDLRGMMEYPPDSAGQLMDPDFESFRGDATCASALEKLRRSRSRTARSLFLIDEDNRLTAKVAIQDVAVAEPDSPLRALSVPILAAVNPVSPTSEVADMLEQYKLADLPVTDLDGHMLGIIYHSDLVQAMQEDATASIQSMVGASRDERALSKPLFAVKKRLPWLQVNLLTAFLAAAVVGLFENTIAQFTALAVLLPVVAGQSGNGGAQALAVTMRGLALREITIRSWLPVMVKEVQAGFINGVAIAITCGLAVYVWSQSIGLVLVIGSSMVLAMTAAGFAGALVPIVLTRLGQDPAQASSIILTTVTDVAGFFSFLGIATLLSEML